AGHAEFPSPVRTGSGSGGVISAHGDAPGHPCRWLESTRSSDFARPGGSVALGGLVILLPLRFVGEGIEPARLVQGENTIEVVELMLQQLGHRSLELHRDDLSFPVRLSERRA